MFDHLSVQERLQRYEAKYGKHLTSDTDSATLNQVISEGYCVIPNFWTQQQCDRATTQIDKCLDRHSKNNIKVWQDDIGADNRIMGSNNLSEDLDLLNDKRIGQWMNRLYNVDSLIGFTMAAKINAIKENKGSGHGWHRDSCVPYQFKAILYLSDVTPLNGPFQYIRESGNANEIIRFCDSHNVDLDENRLDKYSECFESQKLVEFLGSAGTLILVNTRGIHRGKPLINGSRYALTNYYWRPESKIPEHMLPFVN